MVQLEEKYHELYQAMIQKDGNELQTILDDEFELIHMTGLKQNKKVFIQAVMDGTLNYFSEIPVSFELDETDHLRAVGKSRVQAAVFGSGKSWWNLGLQLTFEADHPHRIKKAEAFSFR